MKIIKISNCMNCPLSEIVGVEGDIILFKCTSAANFNNDSLTVGMDAPIPDWCPLDDE